MCLLYAATWLGEETRILAIRTALTRSIKLLRRSFFLPVSSFHNQIRENGRWIVQITRQLSALSLPLLSVPQFGGVGAIHDGSRVHFMSCQIDAITSFPSMAECACPFSSMLIPNNMAFLRN